jgi:hypothetical protein
MVIGLIVALFLLVIFLVSFLALHKSLSILKVLKDIYYY